MCCPCPIGYYCPGHTRDDWGFFDGYCYGEGESGDNAPVKVCQAGRYSDVEGRDECFTCAAGTNTEGQSGMTSCLPCEKGKVR